MRLGRWLFPAKSTHLECLPVSVSITITTNLFDRPRELKCEFLDSRWSETWLSFERPRTQRSHNRIRCTYRFPSPHIQREATHLSSPPSRDFLLAMLHIEVQTPSPEPSTAAARPPTLVDLSRNASVISSSSSSSSTSSLLANTPRPRPVRTFSAPRSLSRDPPATPRAGRPPAYLAREFGLGMSDDAEELRKRAQSRSKSRTKSRNSSVGVKVQLDDFEFGEELGEGSYSTVRIVTWFSCSTSHSLQPTGLSCNISTKR